MSYTAKSVKGPALTIKQVSGLGTAGGLYTDVWTPTAGKRIVLDGFLLFYPEALTVEFFEKVDSTRVSVMKVSKVGNGEQFIEFPGEIFLPVDHLLEVKVSGASSNVWIQAMGHEE